jgi:hypothetical protein
MRLMGTQSGHDTQVSIKQVSKIDLRAVRVGDLVEAVEIAAPLWWPLGRHLDFGRVWGRAEPKRSRGGSAAVCNATKTESGSAPHIFS